MGAQTREKNRVLAPVLCVCVLLGLDDTMVVTIWIYMEKKKGGELYRSYGLPPSLIPLIEMLMSIGWASWGDPFFLPLRSSRGWPKVCNWRFVYNARKSQTHSHPINLGHFKLFISFKFYFYFKIHNPPNSRECCDSRQLLRGCGVKDRDCVTWFLFAVNVLGAPIPAGGDRRRRESMRSWSVDTISWEKEGGMDRGEQPMFK